jgi:hypothetical protein
MKIMENMETQQLGLAEAGQKLLDHSKSAEFTAKRGLVVELFPFIFAASERMSARAISRFLETEQGIKLSSVTINKALKDPAKNWNLYFDMVEPAARIWEREEKKPMREFLFKKQVLLKPFENRLLQAAAKALTPEEVRGAARTLRTKWDSIELEIRLKARPYIEHRLNK